MPKPRLTGGMPAMTQETARVHSPITTQRVRINPKDAIAYYNRGVTRSRLGDNQGAVADYTAASAK
jgi:regulator of sirC expression with transglutaminase-like and TPR domain